MSDMYSRSLSFLQLSNDAIGRIADDDANLDTACFCPQQALELLIKFILQQCNIPFGKTHNIRELLQDFDKLPFAFSKAEDLDILADTITSWEQSGRYGKGIQTTVKTIKRVHNVFMSLNTAYLDWQQSMQQQDMNPDKINLN